MARTQYRINGLYVGGRELLAEEKEDEGKCSGLRKLARLMSPRWAGGMVG